MKILLASLIALLILVSRFTDVSAQVVWPKIMSLDWNPSSPIIAFSLYKDKCDNNQTIYLKNLLHPAKISTLGIFSCPVKGLEWNSTGTKLLSHEILGGAVILGLTDPISTAIYNPSYTMAGRALDVWSPDNLRVANISPTMSTINIWDAETGNISILLRLIIQTTWIGRVTARE